MDTSENVLTIKTSGIGIRLSSLMQLVLILGALFSPLAVFFKATANLDTSFVDDAALLIAVYFILITARFLRTTIAYFPILAFGAAALVSALVNQTPIESTIIQIRSYMLPMAAYFSVCYLIKDKKFGDRFIFSFIALSILLSIVGLIEAITSKHIINELNKFGVISDSTFRIHSLIGHPADYGYYLIFSIAISALLLQLYPTHQKNKRLKIYAAISLLFLNLALAVSRGPLLVLVISAAIFSMFAAKKQRVRLLFLIGIFFVLGLTFSFESWKERTELFFSGEVAVADQETVTEASRVGFYLQTVNVFLQNPFIGVGPGQFGGWVATSTDSSAHKKYGIETYGISSIDVFYPHLVGELGLAGLTLYILIFITLIRKFNQRLKIAEALQDQEASFYLKTAIWSTLMVLLCGFHSMINETFPHMILYWTLAGIAERKSKELVGN